MINVKLSAKEMTKVHSINMKIFKCDLSTF